MSRNGSGTYSKVNTFVAGNTITAAGHNQNWDDLVLEMTNSIAADGQTTITAPLKGANGSVSAPAYSFAADLNSGIYSIGADNIGIAVGGAKILDIASTGMTVTGTLTAGITGLNIIGAVQLTAPANNDTLPIYDLSSTTNSRILLSDFFKVINDFTADASPDSAVDYVVTYDASATAAKKVLLQNLPAILPRGYIDGLILSQGSTTSLAIAAGKCRDSADSINMSLSAFTKTTASWAVGTGNGGLDTGSIASGTWYYAYVIEKSSDGTTDALFTVTYGSPTMPSSYDKKRYIGAFKTDGSSHVPVINQKGGEFFYPAMVNDLSTTVGDNTAHTQTLSVPPSPGVRAKLSVSSTNQTYIAITDLSMTDTAATATFNAVNAGSGGGGATIDVWCNTSGQVRYRMGTTSCTLAINTIGYFDPRGTNA